MQKRRPVHMTQYERPIAPRGWNADGQQFCEQICRVLDDIYRRYGRLRVEDLSAEARALLTGFADGAQVRDLAEAVSAMAQQMGRISDAQTLMQAVVENQQTPNWVLDRLPVGTWLPTSQAMPPSDKWLFAQGQVLDAATYPDAHAMFGGKLPDARGRFLAALDSGQLEFDTLHETGGEKAHTLTLAEMPGHSHEVKAALAATGGTQVHASQGDGGLATQSAGGGAPHNNLPPYLVVRYAIKVK